VIGIEPTPRNRGLAPGHGDRNFARAFLSNFEAPPVYLRTVSRTLELSLQSSLQLSLTVLVRYRSRVQYLALDGVYHPLRAALSSNPTLGKEPTAGDGIVSYLVARALHPLRVMAPVRETWTRLSGRNNSEPPIHHIALASANDGGFGAGLIPVHSPLLGESWLVSFPPLNDMLKFSG
jgi:hypothetical protein